MYGEIGVRPDEAGYLMLGDLQKIMSGYFNRQEREIRERWEMARWQVMHFIAPYSKKKSLRVTDIARFPWEKKRKEIPGKEKVDEIIKRWERFKPNG